MIAGIIAFIVTYFILDALNLNNFLALIIAMVVGVFVARTRKKSKEGKEGKGQNPAPGQTENGAAAVAGQPSVARPHGGQGADGDFNWQQTTYEQPAPELPKRLDEHGNLVTPDHTAPRWADAAQPVRSGSATVADKSWKPRTDGQRVVWRKPVIVNNFVDDYADFGCDGLFNTDLSTAGDHIHGQPGVGLGESGFGAARIQQGQQALPQIHVQHRLFVSLDPALFLPAVQPALFQRVDDVLAVAVQLYHARLLQKPQRLDDGGQLHAVVCGSRRAAGEFLLRSLVAEYRPPAARAGIAGAGSVGVDRNGSHISFLHSTPTTRTVPSCTVKRTFFPA